MCDLAKRLPSFGLAPEGQWSIELQMCHDGRVTITL